MVVRAAPLPRGPGQDGPDRADQAGVVVAGHRLHAGQAPGGQAAQERQPARAVLGAGHVDAEDLPAPVSVDAGRDQAVHVHRPAALADLLGQRVDPHERVRPAVRGRDRKDSTSSSSSLAIALTCDLDRPTTPREAAASPPAGSRRPAGTTWPPPRPAPARPAAGAPGTPGSTTPGAAWDRQLDRPRPVSHSRRRYRCGIHPVRRDLPVARVARHLDVGVHHPLGELADHRPQQIRARRRQGLLELGARNGHNVTCGHFALLRCTETTSKDREVAASHHGDTPYSGNSVTSVPVTPYTTSVDVNTTSQIPPD